LSEAYGVSQEIISLDI